MDSRKLRIVVIDDSPVIGKLLEVMLSREGHHVHTFLHSTEAVRSLLVTGEVAMPDLLFVDLTLPRIDGVQVIRLFRQHAEGKHVPIIVISRLDGIVSRLRARLAGANGYLVKPFKQQEVIALVRNYAARQ